MELFSDEPLKANRTCAGCEHIQAVRFQDKNLFFCSIRKGGRYGRKIKKSAVACQHVKEPTTDRIPCVDGYWGDELEGIQR
jgi:hypothetical protein